MHLPAIGFAAYLFNPHILSRKLGTSEPRNIGTFLIFHIITHIDYISGFIHGPDVQSGIAGISVYLAFFPAFLTVHGVSPSSIFSSFPESMVTCSGGILGSMHQTSSFGPWSSFPTAQNLYPLSEMYGSILGGS